MYKKVGVRKLGKPADERHALIRSQVKDLFKNGFIRTTKVRGKEVIRKVDSLLAFVSVKNLKEVSEYVGEELLVEKLLKIDLKDKKSGFATVVQIKNRPGDNAEQVLIELI